MKDKLEAIADGKITPELSFDFIDCFPALLWRIDVVQNRIEYLNRFKIPGLGAQSGLILQNMDYARQVVLPEDAHLLATFFLAKVPGVAQPGDTPLVWTILYLSVIMIQADFMKGWPMRRS